jgi:hypothetical protein
MMETKMGLAIDESRLAQITELADGAHEPPEDGGVVACAMEAAAYIAGEPWSDHPECVCPVIAAFMRSWNDALPDTDRTALLLPLIPKTIGTRGSTALANRRATMAADWLVRVHTSAWLRLAGLDAQADALASLPEITDFAKTPGLMTTLEAVRKDAAAAREAAWSAAGAAAWDAARAAAWSADWDAAGAAAREAAWSAAGDADWDADWDAARAAAGADARDAAWSAARAAAGEKLPATTKELQANAVLLVERMCTLADEPGPITA